ncbi:hypothetical protein DXG03_008270 [Asterophora parasitica]|uniref:Uncharacterized protein n=1 Tax=Asterophora parasitica TaxID=117018 RepID=A0A9P7G6N1_9AGAR|nr:hypothetical protein DXG03_008270 [Asterophora parasitica]
MLSASSSTRPILYSALSSSRRPFSTILNPEPASSPTSDGKKPLFGTVPSHRSYIFLHASEPPTAFPARVSTPLQRALQLQVTKWGGMVNFSWFGPEHHSQTGNGTGVTAFSSLGGRLEIPELTLENVDAVAETLRRHASEGPGITAEEEPEVHLYVCTHGARDCRCGDVGGAVVRALREEVARRVEADSGGKASRVRVGEVAHGGANCGIHRHAANLLVYPHGDWLGLLKPEDVPSVLTSILEYSIRPFGAQDKPIVPRHWRGRMGLSKDEQVELFESQSAADSDEVHIRPSIQRRLGS